MLKNHNRIHTKLKDYKHIDNLMTSATIEADGNKVNMEQEVFVYNSGYGNNINYFYFTNKQKQCLTIFIDTEMIVSNAEFDRYDKDKIEWILKPYNWDYGSPDQDHSKFLVEQANLNLQNEKLEDLDFIEVMQSSMRENAANFLNEHGLEENFAYELEVADNTPSFDDYIDSNYSCEAYDEITNSISEIENDIENLEKDSENYEEKLISLTKNKEELKTKLEELKDEMNIVITKAFEYIYEAFQLYEVNGHVVCIDTFEYEGNRYWARGCCGQSVYMDYDFLDYARKELSNNYQWIIWPWMKKIM